jgi:hypothetical protein
MTLRMTGSSTVAMHHAVDLAQDLGKQQGQYDANQPQGCQGTAPDDRAWQTAH